MKTIDLTPTPDGIRQIRRALTESLTSAEQGVREIEALIERYHRSGLLDDKAYAEARTASLRRQGRSVRAISEKLKMKGV